MLKSRFAVAFFCVLALAASGASRAQSAPSAHWVGSWAASPMLAEGGHFVRPFSAVTLREIVHLSVGGPKVRVRFSNEFGLDPLTIGNAHVALSAGEDKIKPGSDHALTFAGAATVRIPAGAVMYSDPVALDVAPLSDLAISFYLPSQVMRGETVHLSANQDSYMVDGDKAAAESLPGAGSYISWYFLDGVDVPAVAGSRAIVAFGDSITDGAHSTRNANHRWPNYLAERLAKDAHLAQVSVLDEGIGGNRVLNDGTGPNALARFDRDVLSQNGVRYLIVLESINDIGRLARNPAPEDEVDAKMLEQGLAQLADAAHQHGIKAIGATLTPYGGAGYYSEKGEQIREAVNNWIRTSGVFDAVADFDKATRDSADPKRFNAAYDSGDHLHPADAGYQAMANAIDLAIFAQ